MNNDVGSRVRQVRKAVKLTQTAFGAKLGVGMDVISNIELGRVPAKPLFLNHLCDVYGVSPEWLETGEGEMLRPMTREEEIAAFAGDLLSGEPESFRYRLVSALARLDADDWAVLEKLANEMAKKD